MKRRVAEACDCVCSMRSFWSRLFDPDERVSCFRINLSLLSHVSWPLDISVRSFPSLASATKSSPAPGAERSGDLGVPVKRRVAEACDCVCSMRSFWSRLFDPDERVSCFRINLSLLSHVSWPLDISVRSFPSPASATKSSPAPGAERSGDPGVPVKRRVAEACDCVCSMRSFWSRLFDPDERVSCFRINLSLLSHVSWPLDISVRSFPSPASATKSSPAPGAERSGDPGVPVKRRVAEACDCVCSMRSFWSRLFDPDERVSCFRINLSLLSHVSWPLDISVRSFPSPASATKSSPAPGAERSGDPGVPVKRRVAEACDCVCSMRSFWSRLFDPDERVSCFRINLSLFSHVSWPLDISVRSFPSPASATLSSPAPGAELAQPPVSAWSDGLPGGPFTKAWYFRVPDAPHGPSASISALSRSRRILPAPGRFLPDGTADICAERQHRAHRRRGRSVRSPRCPRGATGCRASLSRSLGIFVSPMRPMGCRPQSFHFPDPVASCRLPDASFHAERLTSAPSGNKKLTGSEVRAKAKTSVSR